VHYVLIPSQAFSFDIVHTAGIKGGGAADDRRRSILSHRQHLFLAEKIDILLTAGACIDDCRKVARKIVAISGVADAGGERNLVGQLWRASQLAVAPWLPINGHRTLSGHSVEEGSLVRRKKDGEGIDAGMNLRRQQIDSWKRKYNHRQCPRGILAPLEKRPRSDGAAMEGSITDRSTIEPGKFS
jgi:hypothetical protein